MMKASRLRGPAGKPGLELVATLMLITLMSIAEGKSIDPVKAEGVLREALVVGLCLDLTSINQSVK